MDAIPFRRRHLRELLEHDRGPAISIYLPGEGSAPNPDHDRLRLRAAIERASELLGPGADDSAGQALESLRALAKDPEFWDGGGGGIAIFRAPGFERTYRLAGDVPELVVVAPTFHTRPLVREIQAPNRYWILELGQGPVRLWRGNSGGASVLDPSPLPEDMDTALGYVYFRDTEVVHRAVSAGRAGAVRGQAGGAIGAFSGHGVGEDDQEPSLRKFFGIVDAQLREFLDGDDSPVVLAAVAEHHPLYRSVSRLERLAPTGIEGAIRFWDVNRVHEEAWPIVLRAAEERIDSSLDLWERAYGRGKGEADASALGRLSVAGRIHLLLTERGRRLWGAVDRVTGETTIRADGGEAPDAGAVEILDELSELVILHGGTALVVPPERMPTATGAAGILR